MVHRPTRRHLLLSAAALTLLPVLPARAGDAPLRVLASAVPHAEILTFVQRRLAPDLRLKIIEITGELRVNELTLAGDADANFYQHRPFLETEEAILKTKFAVTATVHIEPLGIYSRRVTGLDAVPEGAAVSLSSNVTNLSRGLVLLQAAGLIRLRPDLDPARRQLATPRDIVDNPRRLKLLEIEPAQLPRTLDDVTLAVINGNYALQAGLVPAKDALALEPAEGNPYANLLVTVPEKAEDPRIQRLSRLLEGPEVAAFIRERYAGSVIPVHS
ncbi:MetQ/NlpA family ABC transporter substrate-binding protein [Rhodospirillum centenum]|uniref:Lipoprotein n=1 Tax=Rhodospirillum centenum (strain ATCC 51521 / SW) TaxID=414684 RepID=B6IWN8_RHOCS|nr:MetQ/NlpA family ABC transporter substrate-binding protein [Rhodospirillum centenum]ACJ00712.1 NLPA lipoprotein, putative [Rhodospirillum centenum SW]